MIKTVCLFFLLLIHVKGESQRPPFVQNSFLLSSRPVRSPFFDHYISDIALDKTGFLWLSTNKGLLRYDGTSFKKFVLDTSGRFTTSNDVLSLIKTRKEGVVFASTKSGDIYEMRNGRPVLWDTTQRTAYYSYQVAGNMPSMKMMRAFNKSIKELRSKYHLSFKKTSRMAVGPGHFLAVHENESDLLLFNDTTIAEHGKLVPLNGKFESFLQAGSRFFVLTQNLATYEFIPGLNKLVPVENDISPPGSGTTKKSTHFYADFNSRRSFYLSGTRLYEIMSGKNGLYSVFMTETEEMRQPFLQILADPFSGAHFLATKLGGFYTGEYTRLKNHLIPLSLTQHYKDPTYIIPYAVQKLNDSTAVVPNGTFLTVASDGSTSQRTGPDSFIGNRYSIALLPGKDIVCATPGGGLKRFEAKTNYKTSRNYTSVPFEKIDDSQIILLKPEGDSLWVCTHRGIYAVRQDRITTVFNHAGSKKLGVFFEMKSFERMDSASIYMSNQLGLYKLHTKQPFRIDTIQPGVIDYVRHILPVDDMLLLCAYKKGLFLYKDGLYHPISFYNKQHEIKLCHNSFLDDKGMLWITTDKGLFKTTLDGLINSTEPGAPPPLFFKYGGIHDRIENIEFNGGGLPSYAVLHNNTLVYPAINGIVSFNYKQLDERPHFSANSFVYNLRTGINKQAFTSPSDSFRFSSDAEQVYINISIPYFGSMENAILEYKYDNDWVEFPYNEGFQTVAFKTKPGYSYLWIRVRSGYGNDDYATRKIVIHRDYKISERSIFYPALLLIFLFVVFLAVRINSNRINKINRKLEEKIDKKTTELKSMVETKNLLLGIISHDMISPLRHIAMLSNLVVKRDKLDKQEMYETLSTIRHTCEKLNLEFTGVVNWIKNTREAIVLEKEETSLYDMVESSVNIYLALESVRNVSLINDIKKDSTVFVDPKLISPVINNIISNAIKNTYEGEIRIYSLPAGLYTGKTKLVIKDTGIGFKPQALEKVRSILSGDYPSTYANYGSGLGFFMIAELSKLHDIAICIESEPGKGTCVTLVF